MISIPYKAKQFLVFLAKLLIVGGALYFIYNQLVNNEKLDWKQFLELVDRKKSIFGIAFILFLSFLNRFLEILKWQNLAQKLQSISLPKATEQVLAALTAGLFTPNGIGEYAGKALYFPKKDAGEVIFLNLICNGIQMILSILFGIIGLLILGYWLYVGILIGVVFGISLILFLLKKITIKGYSLSQFFQKINALPKKMHRKNIFLAVVRYLTFSHQYYFLFLAFDVNLPYFTLMGTIAATYFIASSLPTFQFFDFAVKGGVAVCFFGLLGINEWIVVFISMLMWFLNIVLPVLIGSIYVFRFKPRLQKTEIP
ncbi:lysylphosphatidylglycerol synthase domain-containing protein [Flavobacterium antarcticum]|uniref:lysylphosphatidylglycerol synthase domain-containing protein n=1 Tax=Flavobacterium antarcticum TaxID=271155 RepID=UPI0003B43729|nr:lysylphosphatidylglycerol synthase domain-containing protein [Flavobacterium antarcticum]